MSSVPLSPKMTATFLMVLPGAVGLVFNHETTALFRPFLANSASWLARIKDVIPRSSLTQCLYLCYKSPDCLMLRHYDATCEMVMKVAGFAKSCQIYSDF